MRPYCPACLDAWSLDRALISTAAWSKVPSALSMHVTCGRALEKIRTAPATFEPERVWKGWAA